MSFVAQPGKRARERWERLTTQLLTLRAVLLVVQGREGSEE